MFYIFPVAYVNISHVSLTLYIYFHSWLCPFSLLPLRRCFNEQISAMQTVTTAHRTAWCPTSRLGDSTVHAATATRLEMIASHVLVGETMVVLNKNVCVCVCLFVCVSACTCMC